MNAFTTDCWGLQRATWQVPKDHIWPSGYWLGTRGLQYAQALVSGDSFRWWSSIYCCCRHYPVARKNLHSLVPKPSVDTVVHQLLAVPILLPQHSPTIQIDFLLLTLLLHMHRRAVGQCLEPLKLSFCDSPPLCTWIIVALFKVDHAHWSVASGFLFSLEPMLEPMWIGTFFFLTF